MFGRLLAGISTSILYSAFESWLIYEHKNVNSLLLFKSSFHFKLVWFNFECLRIKSLTSPNKTIRLGFLVL